MWKRIATAWSLYKNSMALNGLLEALGIRVWGLALMSALLARIVNQPVWVQVIIGLCVFGLVLFVVGFAIALIRVWRSEVAAISSSDSRTTVSRAIFRCDQHHEYFKVVTDEVQRLIDGKQVIYAHQNCGFGDPCKDHWTKWPEGHDKSLFIDYNHQGRRMLPYGKKGILKISDQWEVV